MYPRYALLLVFLTLLCGMLAGCGVSPSPQAPHVTPVAAPGASSVNNPIQALGSSFSSVIVVTERRCCCKRVSNRVLPGASVVYICR
jgi:hypothetical protein